MTKKQSQNPKISIIMGSKSDFATMQHACKILEDFDVAFETKIISAHRTPKRLYEFCESAKKNGIKIIIAGAGGAAHLPGMAAAITDLPVLGVPVESRALKGLDSLLSIAQMPAGIPVGCLAIGEAGAKNAALLAIAILALFDEVLAEKLQKFRQNQTSLVELKPNPIEKS
jgi:5-(carboxyamino)imidazole ribonucleotide mutase